MSESLSAVFVYGTLKRGELRGGAWPRKPLRVEEAFVLGLLYDLGPYPGLILGSGETPDDLVKGELWNFAPEDMPPTLAVLDRIEDCRGRSDDLYTRVAIECTTISGDRCKAFVYLLADISRITEPSRVRPGAGGFVVWGRGRLCGP